MKHYLDEDLADYFLHMAEQLMVRALDDDECSMIVDMLSSTAHRSLAPKVMSARTKLVSVILCFAPEDSELVASGLNLIDPIIDDKDVH